MRGAFAEGRGELNSFGFLCFLLGLTLLLGLFPWASSRDVRGGSGWGRSLYKASHCPESFQSIRGIPFSLFLGADWAWVPLQLIYRLAFPALLDFIIAVINGGGSFCTAFSDAFVI